MLSAAQIAPALGSSGCSAGNATPSSTTLTASRGLLKWYFHVTSLEIPSLTQIFTCVLFGPQVYWDFSSYLSVSGSPPRGLIAQVS